MWDVLPSLVEVEEEEELVSEAGELMRWREGSRGGEKGGTGAQIWDQGVHSLVEKREVEDTMMTLINSVTITFRLKPFSQSYSRMKVLKRVNNMRSGSILTHRFTERLENKTLLLAACLWIKPRNDGTHSVHQHCPLQVAHRLQLIEKRRVEKHSV